MPSFGSSSNAERKPRERKTVEENLAILPDLSDLFDAATEKDIFAKVGADGLAVVGEDSEGRPVVAPIFNLSNGNKVILGTDGPCESGVPVGENGKVATTWQTLPILWEDGTVWEIPVSLQSATHKSSEDLILTDDDGVAFSVDAGIFHRQSDGCARVTVEIRQGTRRGKRNGKVVESNLWD